MKDAPKILDYIAYNVDWYRISPGMPVIKLPLEDFVNLVLSLRCESAPLVFKMRTNGEVEYFVIHNNMKIYTTCEVGKDENK